MLNLKQHVKDHKGAYLLAANVVVIAGITVLIMRSRLDCSISSVNHGTAKRVPDVPELFSINALENNRGGLVLGNNYALNNVSFISQNRQGPPSWVVRCLETNNVYTSQRSAANNMELLENELSQHLNGVRDNVRGYHFERVCMAA